MSFPQLTTTTAFSLLQSTVAVEEYVAAGQKAGYGVLGICDRNVLTAAVSFYQSCQKYQIKPVIGLHLDYYSPVQQEENELLLFAASQAGYETLIRLSSKKMSDGQVALEEYLPAKDVIGILPLRNELTYLRYGHPELVEKRLEQLKGLLPELYYSVEINSEQAEADSEWFAAVGIKPFATAAVVSLKTEELRAVKVMEHLKAGTQINELEELQLTGTGQLLPASQAAEYFANVDSRALANAEAFADRCDWQLPLHQKLLPAYPLENQSAGDFLEALCRKLLPQRVAEITNDYQERLAYELSVIHQMGFDDYFLIVWDVMDFAHRTGIVTGAGRGSAAGSLVAYVLAITDVDPIRYDLLFERFLNPERYSMPDIDLDIPDNRRQEVLHYVQKKYGRLKMAQIATFGTMAAKMVLKDTARVFGLSQSEANRWSKAVPTLGNGRKITLKEAYDQSAALRELTESSPKNHTLFEVALVLEGLPRHVSTHAAGVVISDRELLELVPLQAGSDDILLTQFTMNDVETVGLLKMDFLGLRNLSIIDDTLRGIKKVTGKVLSQKDISLEDPDTLALFQRGDTAGIFQFESAGIRNVLRRLEPENIEEIAAVNALYRPGPAQNIDHFIQRKKGREKVTYLDDSLRPILKNTYGIMVYQEQVMQVANRMAGFSLGQADLLRRAMGKKKKTILDEQRQNFVNGAVSQGHSREKAEEVYGYIERFAGYGFNRSHAFAYSFVGFQMAYLKVHYPGPFFAALLQSVRGNTGKIKEYLTEAKKRGIRILPPAINKSSFGFYLEDMTTIRFGLGAVKGLRRDFIAEVVKERKLNGPYTSLDNFLYRIDNKWRKNDILEPLIQVGVFDEIEENRRQLRSELEGKIQNIQYSGGSLDLLDLMTLKVTDIREYSLEEKLDLEERYLGVYLSGHPAEKYGVLQERAGVRHVSELVAGEKAKVLLYLREIREIRTKKGDQMAFLEGNDPTGEVSVTIFPDLYRQVRQQFEIGDVLYIEGKGEVSKYNQELQLIAERLMTAEKAQAQLDQTTCYLRILPAKETAADLNRLLQVIRSHPGNVRVILVYASSGVKKILSHENQIENSAAVISELAGLLGSENVVFK